MAFFWKQPRCFGQPAEAEHSSEEWNDVCTEPTPVAQDVVANKFSDAHSTDVGTSVAAPSTDAEDDCDLPDWEVLESNDSLEEFCCPEPLSVASTCVEDMVEDGTPASKPSTSPTLILEAGESADPAVLSSRGNGCNNNGSDAEIGDAPVSSSEDDPPVDDRNHGFRCAACKTLLFEEHVILSSNYQAMNGPGYLTKGCHNVVTSKELQTVQYTSGKYTIQEVMCCCNIVLGVTYTGAADSSNQYKVGNFLIDRTRLVLPDGVTHPKDKLPYK